MPKIAYEVVVNGNPVYIEATNQAQAVRAATRPLVGGVRTLTGGEVMSLARAGTTFIDAAAKDEPAGDAGQTEGGDPPAADKPKS